MKLVWARFSSMPISDRTPLATKRQGGVTENAVSVTKPSTRTTRSTRTIGGRWGMSSSMAGKVMALFNFLGNDGSHFARCNQAVLASHFAAYGGNRSEEHTSELQSLMRISYAVFCLKKKTTT